MKQMNSTDIRSAFLDFFKARGHAIIPSASLVPENDPSVLFNTAGMQPLVPYLLGEPHPQGKRLVDAQKCVRTVDIDEVGDNTHLTFFEMLGNWSLGDYWKKEAIGWSYELLTSKTEGFGLDPQRLYVTCFEGDSNAPKDEESFAIWKEIFEGNGVTGERIYFRPKEKNWWSAGDNGPCGPDTEMFYDLTGTLTQGMTLDEYLEADDSQKVVEIWNNVFMQYLAKDGKVVSELPNKNVDTGSGLERLVAVIQGTESVYDTDIFAGIIEKIRQLSEPERSHVQAERIIADHIRTSVFMISDGVFPSNTDRGYILRRLIRRAVRFADSIDMKENGLLDIAELLQRQYRSSYPNVSGEGIIKVLQDEEIKFRKTLMSGLKEFEAGTDPFILFSSFGFPIELTEELAKEKGIAIDRADFDEKFRTHQELSRAGSEHKFKGGLAGTGEMEVKYHTATHLLHQALREVLGTSVEQKGSNITEERLRFDFSFDRKLTDEEKKRVEDLVNEMIKLNLPVHKVMMKKEDAERTGALHFFGDKYGDEVSIYFIGDTLDHAFSKEFCGGPHVENTGKLGLFKIAKEEASSSGIRRIKAVLTS